jgi:hypothetical protein
MVGLETHEIGIIPFLTVFKEVVVYTGEFPGHLPSAHIMAIEEATHPSMPGRGEPITDERRRDGVEATVIEAIHTGVLALSIRQQTSIIEAFLGTLEAIVDEGLQRFGHMRIPCSRSIFARGVTWCKDEPHS